MFWYAHLFLGVGVVSFFTLDPIVLTLAAFLSMIPDLDRPFGHRRWFSHSIFVAFVFAVVGLVASRFNLLYAWAVFLAASSHVLSDFLTKSGVPILYPWKKNHYGLRAFPAHSKTMNKSFMLLGIFLLLFNLWRAYPV